MHVKRLILLWHFMFIKIISVLQNACFVLYKVTGDEVSTEEVDGDDADNKVPYDGLLSVEPLIN